MPIYEYECKKCGEVTELLVGVGAAGKKKPACGACGSKRLERLFSAASIVSKGAGGAPAGGGGPSSSCGGSCGSCNATSCPT